MDRFGVSHCLIFFFTRQVVIPSLTNLRTTVDTTSTARFAVGSVPAAVSGIDTMGTAAPTPPTRTPVQDAKTSLSCALPLHAH